MSEWPEVQLKNVIKIKHGYAFKGEYFSDKGDYILLTPGNTYPAGGLKLKGNREKYYKGNIPEEYILSRGDLLVVMTDLTQDAAILGGATLIDKDNLYLHNQRLGLVSHREVIDKKFLYYYFNWQYFRDQVKASSNGATVKHTSPERIYKCKIFLPKKSIQRKIAAILSIYDDLIENNKRRIALLGKMAEEIYREWFVRMRFPKHDKVKFEKGVPRVWEKKRFGDFCVLKRGYDLPNSKVEPGEYPVIASTSIKTFHNQYKVNPPVITTGRSGTLGKVLYTPRQAWPLNTTLYVKDFLGNSPYFIYYTLKNMGLENFNSGAGVPTLNRNHINGIFIAVPSASLQKEFNAKLSTFYQNKEALENSIGILEKSKKLLLVRLISGKLSVEGLDIQSPPSMQDEQDVAHA